MQLHACLGDVYIDLSYYSDFSFSNLCTLMAAAFLWRSASYSDFSLRYSKSHHLSL
jgi:hypothetical protein